MLRRQKSIYNLTCRSKWHDYRSSACWLRKVTTMFTQKPPSLLTKMGDAYAILLISVLFMVGGLLLSHQTPLAVMFALLMLPLPVLLYVSTRVKPTACE